MILYCIQSDEISFYYVKEKVDTASSTVYIFTHMHQRGPLADPLVSSAVGAACVCILQT